VNRQDAEDAKGNKNAEFTAENAEIAEKNNIRG